MDGGAGGAWGNGGVGVAGNARMGNRGWQGTWGWGTGVAGGTGCGRGCQDGEQGVAGDTESGRGHTGDRDLGVAGPPRTAGDTGMGNKRGHGTLTWGTRGDRGHGDGEEGTPGNEEPRAGDHRRQRGGPGSLRAGSWGRRTGARGQRRGSWNGTGRSLASFHRSRPTLTPRPGPPCPRPPPLTWRLRSGPASPLARTARTSRFRVTAPPQLHFRVTAPRRAARRQDACAEG